jgi:hypothetical protein
VSSTAAVTWVWETRSSTRRPANMGSTGVVIAINPEIRLLGHPHHGPPVGVRQPTGQRSHPGPFLDEPFGRDGADRAMHPLINPVAPAIELVLEVEMVREPTPWHEVGAHEPVRALQDPLRVRCQLRLIGLVGSELFV